MVTVCLYANLKLEISVNAYVMECGFNFQCYCILGHLNLKENSSMRSGLMSDLSVECSSCSEATSLKTSSVTNQGQSFDVNRRAVYHSLETGGGYEGLVSFCSIMNMPCISSAAYYKLVDTILVAQEAEAKDEMQQASQRLRDYIFKENGEKNCDDVVVDVAVSFDGTWAKRGFTSLTGVVFVLAVDTGEVLDYHVLSKECRKCTMKKSRCKTDKEFEEWQIEHISSNQCDINFTGSSPAMEAEGAKILWSRSVELHKIRYKWMVCDGDSKAHAAVEDTYDECKVEKLDCVGHVQKRMGKHLMNLKSTTKGKLADGKSIGGQGRLTEVRIKRIQRYYGLAIRQNTLKKAHPTENEVNVAVYTMKKNIIAILHHSIQSKDLAKQHRFCPVGESSWCKWQQDIATGTKTYKPDDCLPGVFCDLLSPTFMTLSESKLLERCVRGATQNRNECINALVWARCPKNKHHGAKSVRCAVASSVCHFHSGASSKVRVMERLSIPAGVFTKQASARKDKRRIRKADRQTTDKAKRQRQGVQLLQTRREEALREAEGVMYEAGAF